MLDLLEDITFINTKPWENNPDKKNPIYVDAYDFRSLGKLGYIAFFYNTTTRKWIIKSFHLSDETNKAMEIAMNKALQKRLKDKK